MPSPRLPLLSPPLSLSLAGGPHVWGPSLTSRRALPARRPHAASRRALASVPAQPRACLSASRRRPGFRRRLACRRAQTAAAAARARRERERARRGSPSGGYGSVGNSGNLTVWFQMNWASDLEKFWERARGLYTWSKPPVETISTSVLMHLYRRLAKPAASTNALVSQPPVQMYFQSI